MYEHSNKMAVGPETTTTINTKQVNFKQSKSTKQATILKLFLSGKSLNRFEAEHYHDHCLNSTVSTLQNGLDIQVDRERESVPCMGHRNRVSVCRYWLNTDPNNIHRARVLLTYLERKA